MTIDGKSIDDSYHHYCLHRHHHHHHLRLVKESAENDLTESLFDIELDVLLELIERLRQIVDD